MRPIKQKFRVAFAATICSTCVLILVQISSKNSNVIDIKPDEVLINSQLIQNDDPGRDYQRKTIEGDFLKEVEPKKSEFDKIQVAKFGEPFDERVENSGRKIKELQFQENQNANQQENPNVLQTVAPKEKDVQTEFQILRINQDLEKLQNLKPDKTKLPLILGSQEKPVETATNARTEYPHVVNGKFIPLQRIVHLDLKGAPPKAYYFEKFFSMIKRLGATGILIEWEDTFPFAGELLHCRNGNAYSESEVRSILSWARDNDLEVIPLVQTFGHLEWLLKHEQFAHLRETKRYPQTICPTHNNSIDLIKLVIDQVMALHGEFGPGKFFHIGADEAFQVGLCKRCMDAIQNKFNYSNDLFLLNHIATVAQYVKSKYGRRVMVWHDMIMSVESDAIKQTKIHRLVEPVIWAYVEDLSTYLYEDTWTKFQQFPYVWAASAYKGADAASRFYSNVPHYLKNHITWSSHMTSKYQQFHEFRGIILSGWQRYDHFAVLCELLPVGIPSLAVNLLVVKNGGVVNYQIINETSQILQCNADYIDVYADGVVGMCEFPGYKIYQYIQELHQRLEDTKDDNKQISGWLSRYNVMHNYSSAWTLDEIMGKAQDFLAELYFRQAGLRVELSTVFHDDTVDEFIIEYIQPEIERLEKIISDAKRIANIRTHPVRPLAITALKNGTDRPIEA